MLDEFKPRNYEGNDGKRVYITEVVAESFRLLESRESINQASMDQQMPPWLREVNEDNLPF